MTRQHSREAGRSWNNERTRSMVLAAVFSALIAVGAFIRIPLPFLSFSLQTLFVALADIVLGRRWAVVSVLVYIAVGLAGFPVFSTGGGIGYIVQPSFGFLIGFVLWVWISGSIVERLQNPTAGRLFAAQLAGVFSMYAVALPYYYLIMTFYQGDPISAATLFTYCFLSTAPGDVLKSWLAAWMGKRVRSQLRISGR
ncbi:MAG: biotin transporter BioY [Clostridia bacterium]|nr:biotin transporter BioY [Clostridia bacterium]